LLSLKHANDGSVDDFAMEIARLREMYKFLEEKLTATSKAGAMKAKKEKSSKFSADLKSMREKRKTASPKKAKSEKKEEKKIATSTEETE
jgi:hypothetical protein